MNFKILNIMEKIKELKLEQVKLGAKDLERVEVLKKMIGETNRTRVVITALELAELVVKNMKNGNQIAIEHPDNQKEYIRITGT